jgi:ABC-type branched-subunit amino acid transport system permease subunit
MSFGLLTVFGGEEPIKTLISTVIGLFLATIGLDIVSGLPRFAFGVPQLLGGVDFIVIICGIFGVAEVLKLVALNWVGVTKGPMGLTDIGAPTLGSLNFSGKVLYYYLVLLFLITSKTSIFFSLR